MRKDFLFYNFLKLIWYNSALIVVSPWSVAATPVRQKTVEEPCAGTGWLPVNLTILFKGNRMRKDIHPDYKACEVTCACGNKFEVKSDKETMSIDICNACHPFFTGSEKIVDAAGRVEKFKKKFNLQ